MKISNNYQQQTFTSAYINMQSLNNYGNKNGKSLIIKAIKDKNTPLRKFIKDVINTKQFENESGDCFISFKHKKSITHLSDIITISFTKMQERAKKYAYNAIETEERLQKLKPQKEIIANRLADGTSFRFALDNLNLNTDNCERLRAEQFAEYLKSKNIVEDLKKHIEKFRNMYVM